MTDDYEPQTAMLLTQQEWDDLCDILNGWRQATTWADHEPGVLRGRALAERIIEANQ
jgi:hypothetical protein